MTVYNHHRILMRSIRRIARERFSIRTDRNLEKERYYYSLRLKGKKQRHLNSLSPFFLSCRYALLNGQLAGRSVSFGRFLLSICAAIDCKGFTNTSQLLKFIYHKVIEILYSRSSINRLDRKTNSPDKSEARGEISKSVRIYFL